MNGWAKVLANISAVGVICWLLFLTSERLERLHTSTVTTLQEQIRAQREHDEKMHETVHKAIDRNTRYIERILRILEKKNESGQ